MGDVTNNDDRDRKREEAIRKIEEARKIRAESISKLNSEQRNLANDFFRLLTSFKEITPGQLYQFNATSTETYTVRDLANSRISACLVSLYLAAEKNGAIKDMFKTMTPKQLDNLEKIMKNADLSARYNIDLTFKKFHQEMIAPPKAPEKKVTFTPEVKTPEIKKPPEVKSTADARRKAETRRAAEPKSRSESTIKTTNRFPKKGDTKPKYQVAARGPDRARLTRPPKSPVVSNEQQEDRQRKYTPPPSGRKLR